MLPALLHYNRGWLEGGAVEDERLCWVGFHLVKGIGPARFRRLQETFGSLRAAWEAPPARWREAGLSAELVARLVRLRATVDLPGLVARWEAQGIRVLTWEDEEYPQRLRHIPQSPPVLYIRGALRPEDDWAVAVVGTRKVTPYGRQVALEVAETLARHGVTVVSGLARGVDGLAHKAALEVGGRTIAVLGSGVDRIYPPEHRRLAERILTHGALVSDYPPGTPPEGANFPPRNRIISGLALAVVIVEAGMKSGALVTASFAADQGREVFAVPGSIYAPQSQGTNWLIQQGARPLLRPQEVLEALELSLLPVRREARRVLKVSPSEQQVLKFLGAEPVHVDDLSAQAGLPVQEVLATLALLELKGLVRQVGSMSYVRLGEAGTSYRVEEV
ncbi:MAG TPA: DNA-protecting protein DprA [Anaerolineae bacterium]|nr:DNA-protecting protein DprA [Anaerolineae bacterium]